MHQGPVVEKGGDVFGDTVNLAARLTEMATRGQIITSLDTVQLLTPIQKMDCRQLYSIPVRGKDREVPICELMWSDADDHTQVVAQRASTDSGTALRLIYRSRVMVVGGDRRSVVLGREGTADLVIADRMASRAHCEIEQRQDKFVLADHSANGTYLSIDGDREIVLRREEALLRGHGFITLGQSRASATEFVEFYCE
jgi:adenylate cyclase